MPGTVRHAKLESRTSRSRLKRGRQPHWQAIVPGRVHLGYQIFKGARVGRWVLRRYIGGGKYRCVTLGRADDTAAADGVRVLDFATAEAKARASVDGPAHTVARITVRSAYARYLDHKKHLGAPIGDLASRGAAHILPVLGDLVVSTLTAETLRRWLATLAASPAQTRPRAGQPQYAPSPEGDEALRRRRASANRVLTMLKAALNFAYDEGWVPSRDAWGRKLKPFRAVEVARVRYLNVPEAQRLINAADSEFRPLLRAALETGARYGELARMEVADFNADAGTLAVRKSKSGKSRHIVLTEDGAEFLRAHTAGRSGAERLFAHSNGLPWKPSEQARPMAAANTRAKLTPPIGFHGLRHTWASLAVMNGMPLMVVARNLGHADTGMVEKHYGHLAPGFFTAAIRAGAPRYGVAGGERRVAPLR